MAVNPSKPWGLGLLFASFFGQCFSIQSLAVVKIKLLAVTGDKTLCPSATETHYTPFTSLILSHGDTLCKSLLLQKGDYVHGSD